MCVSRDRWRPIWISMASALLVLVGELGTRC